MLKNVGRADQVIRLLAAVLLVSLYLTGTVTGTTGMVVLALAFIALVTGVFRFCPLYRVCGMRTCRR